MRIFIPTRGRTALQKTVERLGRAINRRFLTTLVCPLNEVKELKARYPGEVEVWGCRADGIAATRQWILQEAKKSDEGVVLMLDDDLPTWRKRAEGAWVKGQDVKYTKATTEEIEKGLDTFASMMKGYAHGSIGHALFCQTQPPISYNGRMLRALAYNLERIPANVKFRLKVMEDFDIQLQLLTRGYENIVYNGIVQDQHQNNSEGGCSLYRTSEVQAEAAHALAKLWPDIVTVVTRAPKREWIGMGDRTDVRVNWRRAFAKGEPA